MSRALASFALLTSLLFTRSARAEDWIWSSGTIEEEAGSIVRVQTRLSLWVAEFDRPERACDTFDFGGGIIEPVPAFELRAAQEFPPFFGCPASNSEEVAFGAGIEASFRVISPLHVTVGFDVLYTAPDSSIIKNQIILAVPFSILITVYEWSLRPIFQPKITPLLYVTDDSRDYTLGADLGMAWRVLEWGDLSLTVGYSSAETVSSWQVQLALHPI